MVLFLKGKKLSKPAWFGRGQLLFHTNVQSCCSTGITDPSPPSTSEKMRPLCCRSYPDIQNTENRTPVLSVPSTWDSKKEASQVLCNIEAFSALFPVFLCKTFILRPFWSFLFSQLTLEPVQSCPEWTLINSRRFTLRSQTLLLYVLL